MQRDKQELTIKDFLTHYFTWLFGGGVFILGMYINSVVSPVDYRVSLIERDVKVNAQDIQDLKTVKATVIENSVKLDEVLQRLDKIDARLHSK